MRATATGTSEIKFDDVRLTLRPNLVNPPDRLVQIHGLSLDVQANPLDVTGDGHVRSSDALAVVNYLNAFGAGPVAEGELAGPSSLDADENNVITAADALAIINYLNAGLATAEGESTVGSAAAAASAADADLLALLASDLTETRRRK
jgi:hypothetical protein